MEWTRDLSLLLFLFFLMNRDLSLLMDRVPPFYPLLWCLNDIHYFKIFVCDCNLQHMTCMLLPQVLYSSARIWVKVKLEFASMPQSILMRNSSQRQFYDAREHLSFDWCMWTTMTKIYTYLRTSLTINKCNPCLEIYCIFAYNGTNLVSLSLDCSLGC